MYYDTFNHWAENDINYTTNTLKVFKGYGDFTFRPENNITRAEFITILARTAYKQELMKEIYTSDMSYNDMSDKHWSYTFIISMNEFLKTNKFTLKDIFPGSNFYPDKAITREESAALIGAFCKFAIYDTPLHLSDVSANSKFYDEIERLNNAGIIVGYEDNTFRGNTNITRAESAAMIKRVYLDMKTGDKSKYLTNIEFMPIRGEDIYSYFGNYNFNSPNANDKRFIKAKDTLEYISFGGGGYISNEDSHLYDLNAVKTMEELRSSGYFNVAGTNYYMIMYGNYSNDEKLRFCNEILANVIARNDFKDSELMQIFKLVSNYDVKENLYISALEKWYNLTKNDDAKANIIFFRYACYIKNNNKDALKKVLYDDLKKSNNMPSLLNINFNIDTTAIDFRNYSFGDYGFSLYKDTNLYRYLLNMTIPFNKTKVVELPNLLMVEKASKTVVNMENYENIFCKYSVNRLYALNFLGERERAFVEGINDYYIIKTFEIYRKSPETYNDKYTGILKKLK